MAENNEQTQQPSRAVTPFYLDKAFWLTVLTPLFVVLSKKLGVPLDASEIAGIVVVILGFIVGHKWKSGNIVTAEVTAEATKAAALANSQIAAQTAAANDGPSNADLAAQLNALHAKLDAQAQAKVA